MTEEQKIRRRTPTVAEQERLRKAMTEESRPEAMDAVLRPRWRAGAACPP